MVCNIQSVFSSILYLLGCMYPQHIPRFKCHGGSGVEDIALQNIQARVRMVMSYMFAQLLPWIRGRAGYLLVLSASNVDEALRGYMTKYDCSSGDINPIGSISKKDLMRMLLFAGEQYGIQSLGEIVRAVPTVSVCGGS